MTRIRELVNFVALFRYSIAWHQKILRNGVMASNELQQAFGALIGDIGGQLLLSS
jgi:hypothetical protein